MDDAELLRRAPEIGQSLIGKVLDSDAESVRLILAGKAAPYLIRRMVDKYRAIYGVTP
jgi:hypothetical protein